ncbi:MAG: class I SAM-dependent methyltransferase, partial [Candidatus Binatia bacterium]
MTIPILADIVKNELVHDESGIWLLKGHDRFAYSDGVASEQYLGEVFGKASDLSSRSRELETHIKDWPSEYHLTRKRAQLLSGFQFERSLKVLEVGCGCGAITRHLGETFESVVSIEGSVSRARLARQRTRDLDSVSIVCAPFQEIEFEAQFDVIFCVGVYEYSGAFIAAEDPYDAVLNYFSKILSENGCVVIAIENQFGLKYFSSAGEDHLGVMFEGLEGYHKGLGRVRTFGKAELKKRLQTYFQTVNFYYPFPDYKIPDCVFSESFMTSRQAGEIVANLRPRDYHLEREPMWDFAASALELDRNGVLDFFSNSFLIMASRSTSSGPRFDQEGIIFSANRMDRFSTVTRILKQDDDRLLVSKRKIQKPELHENGPLRLMESESDWMGSHSLQTILHLRAKDRRRSLDSLFEPCLSWVATMRAESTLREGMSYLGGEHVDSIWCNAYPTPEGCRIIDREWVW